MVRGTTLGLSVIVRTAASREEPKTPERTQ
jgi:hypothetical protein